MKTLAYALAGCLLILAPTVAADSPDPSSPDDSPCSVFSYWLEPEPGYQVNLACLPIIGDGP